MPKSYPKFPFTFSDCVEKGLFCNTWFDLTGKLYEALPFEEGALDFEWLMTEENERSIAPLIGSAQDSMTGELFVWLSDRILNRNQPPKLCSVGPLVKRLRCHNIAADRPKVAESHLFEDSIQWTCTMGTHLLVSGIGSQQSWGFNEEEGSQPYYTEFSAKNGLISVHQFWVPGSDVTIESKETRDIFVEGCMQDVRDRFQEIMDYSLRDSVLVNEIAEFLIPAFHEAVPSDIRQEAAKIRGNVSLCVSPYFTEWLLSCEEQYQIGTKFLNAKAQKLAALKAQEFQEEVLATLKTYKLDEIDGDRFRTKKGLGPLMKKYGDLSSVALNMQLNDATKKVVEDWGARFRTRSWEPNAEGLPKWASKIADISYESTLTQDLCQLRYFSQQVTFEPGLSGRKFCYVDKSTGEILKVFSPKKGPSTTDNCGSLFSKDFIPLFEDGSIKSESPIANEITAKAAELSYWTSIRSRLFKISLQQNLEV